MNGNENYISMQCILYEIYYYNIYNVILRRTANYFHLSYPFDF